MLQKVFFRRKTEASLVDASIRNLLGYRFRHPELLVTALTHPSHAFENSLDSNQRLEFLGDAVLSLVVAEELFRAHPKAQEGELTQRRSEIVQGVTLTRIAREMGLGHYLFLGRGEEKQGGRRTSSNLANVLESIIGAIYLDRGMEPARDFIRRQILSREGCRG